MKIGYITGKILGCSIIVLAFAGACVILKLSIHILHWVIYGTFVL